MIFLELFWTFFKIGLFTFGGGYAMIPMITDEVVAHGWLDMETVVDFIAVSESTPGPFAANIATFVGNKVGSEFGGPFMGVLGAACTTFGVVLPSYIIILIVSKFFYSIKDNKFVSGALSGVHPAAMGLIAAAAASILLKNVFPGGEYVMSGLDWVSLVTTGSLFALSRFKMGKKKKPLSPLILIGIGAVVGIVVYGIILK
ncbi:MAG: chromate transporter [Clostridia bacterium]|nr:chromate transporter [Clostridia bacterium]